MILRLTDDEKLDSFTVLAQSATDKTAIESQLLAVAASRSSNGDRYFNAVAYSLSLRQLQQDVFSTAL